jgi:hypothetical protein
MKYSQVGRIDAGEAAVRVDRLDARADVEAVVVLLGPLVGVERLLVTQRPLTLTPRPAVRARGARPRRHGLLGDRHRVLLLDGTGDLAGGSGGRRRRGPQMKSTSMSDGSGVVAPEERNRGCYVSKPDR